MALSDIGNEGRPLESVIRECGYTSDSEIKACVRKVAEPGFQSKLVQYKMLGEAGISRLLSELQSEKCHPSLIRAVCRFRGINLVEPVSKDLPVPADNRMFVFSPVQVFNTPTKSIDELKRMNFALIDNAEEADIPLLCAGNDYVTDGEYEEID